MKTFIGMPLRVGSAVLVLALVFVVVHHPLDKFGLIGLCVSVAFFDACVSRVVGIYRRKSKRRNRSSTSAALIILGAMVTLPRPARASEPLVCDADKFIVSQGDVISLRFHAASGSGIAKLRWTVSAGTLADGAGLTSWHLTDVSLPSKVLRADLHDETVGDVVVCSVPVLLTGGLLGNGQTTATEWLTRDVQTQTDYGLYTYLLFSGPPANIDSEVLKQLLTAYFKNSWNMENLKGMLSDAQINVFFLPVKSRPQNKLTQNVDWISQNIDAGLSLEMLNKLPGNHPDNPYLVVCDHPLHTKTQTSGRCIVHDLSLVPSSVIPDWITTVERQALQGTVFQKWTVDDIALRVKTALAMVGLTAVQVGDVRDSVQKIVPFGNAADLSK